MTPVGPIGTSGGVGPLLRAAARQMRHLGEVWRIESDETRGTLGAFEFDRRFFCFTIEPPWRGNRKDNRGTPENEASCIAPGRMECFVRADDRWPRVLEIVGERGRDGILVHSGTDWEDSAGCVLVGQHGGSLWDLRGLQQFLQHGFILRSRATLTTLCTAFGPGRHDFIIHSIDETKKERVQYAGS